MSVFRKFLDRFKIDKVNDGKPYSFEGLMNMSDAELGALYRNNGEGDKDNAAISEESESKITSSANFIFLSSSIMIAIASYFGGAYGFSHLMPKIWSFTIMGLLSMALGTLLFILTPIAELLYDHIVHRASIKAGANAFKNVKKPNVKLEDIQSLVDDSIRVENRTVSKFLHKVKKALWMGKEDWWMNEPCHLYDYPDEDLGHLVKILLPIMKLEHDGGSLNDESFKVLDDELHLSERIDSFNKEIPDIRNRIEEEKIRKKKKKEAKENHEKYEKKRKAIEDSVSIANSMLTGLNTDHDRNKVLEEHPEFRRIKDLNKKLSKQKTRLDVNLAAHQE